MNRGCIPKEDTNFVAAAAALCGAAAAQVSELCHNKFMSLSVNEEFYHQLHGRT
jgi:hypothetical protein